jgi:hypothetical protein
MKTDKEKEDNNDLVIHYKTHRKILGIMGISLPLILLISTASQYINLEDSISDFYYTYMRDVFVVILCSVSLFLLTYKGYGRKDFWASNIAGVLGFMTAFTPTNFGLGTLMPRQQLVETALVDGKLKPFTVIEPNAPFTIAPIRDHLWLGKLHLACAALFLLTLAYIAIREFTKTHGDVILPNRTLRAQSNHAKARVNNFYRFCGWTIVVTIALLSPIVFSQPLNDFYSRYNLVFWGETICLVAFGSSWLRKGAK